jgi:hypothetical protein
MLRAPIPARTTSVMIPGGVEGLNLCASNGTVGEFPPSAAQQVAPFLIVATNFGHASRAIPDDMLDMMMLHPQGA